MEKTSKVISLVCLSVPLSTSNSPLREQENKKASMTHRHTGFFRSPLQKAISFHKKLTAKVSFFYATTSTEITGLF